MFIVGKMEINNGAIASGNKGMTEKGLGFVKYNQPKHKRKDHWVSRKEKVDGNRRRV